MKKGTKIALIILAILVVAAAGLCVWQWNNLMAVKTSLSYSREDLSQMMEQNNQRVDAISEQLPGVTVRDLTDEERAALRDNTLDREELIDRLVGKEQPVESAQTPEANGQPADGEDGQPAESVSVQSPSPSPSPSPDSDETKREQLARYLAEIYVMKAEYTDWLEAENAAAIEEFNALPEGQKTAAAKYKIGIKHMRAGLAKEAECDQKMAEIEEKIQTLLQELGMNTSLVDEIQAAYEEEKELKKAYFLGLH